MTEQNFCYWLQGLFEMGNPTHLDERQTQIIKDHLQLVFKKITPDRRISVEETISSLMDKNTSYCSKSDNKILYEGYFPLNTAHTGLTAKGLC